MANLNKVFLIGNLTRDPELRYTPNGAAVTDLGVAVNRYYQTKEGERREDVTFLDVTVWNRAAENCCQYLKKGRPVHIEGFLKLDTWDDKTTGEKRSKLKVEADNVQFLGGRQDSGGGPAEDDMGSPARETRRAAPPESRGSGTNGASRGSGNGPATPPKRQAPPTPADSEDDDIPF